MINFHPFHFIEGLIMRMWMIDPRILCRKHLLGEHVELSMFIGTFNRQMKINGYVKNNLVEPLSIQIRHDELVTEILRRKMKHNSPLVFDPSILNYLPIEIREVKVDKVDALDNLIRRCPVCRSRYQILIDTDWVPLLDSDTDHITGGVVYSRDEHLNL